MTAKNNTIIPPKQGQRSQQGASMRNQPNKPNNGTSTNTPRPAHTNRPPAAANSNSVQQTPLNTTTAAVASTTATDTLQPKRIGAPRRRPHGLRRRPATAMAVPSVVATPSNNVVAIPTQAQVEVVAEPKE